MPVGVPGFRELQRELQEVAERGGDPRPALREVGDDYREAQAGNFARGGRPRWKPLSPEYAARKARQGRGSQVGVATGGLRDSLTREGDRYHLNRVRRDVLEVGTRNPVVNLFNSQHGGGRNQPKRKVQVLTPAMRRTWLRWVQDYLVEGRLP